MVVRLASLLALSLALFAGSASVQAGITNGSFETGLTGWTKGGTATAATSSVIAEQGLTPTDGARQARLNVGGSLAAGTLSQDITSTIVGQNYKVSFDVGAPVTSLNAYFQAFIGGVLEFSKNGTGAAIPYSSNYFFFQATSTTSPLTFAFNNQGPTHSWYLDNVVVTAVPEPATTVICGLGLVGMVFGAARRGVNRRKANKTA